MKKIIKYLFLLTGGSFILTSCNDFLDREPLDSVTPDNFFFTENDLAAYAVKHYNFTTHEGFNAGIWKNDNATDNQAATDYDKKWIPGQWKVPEAYDNPASNDPWYFSAIREANYFLATVVPRFENEAHYLNPIAITHFRITASNPNDLSTSIIYQNPGWPIQANEGPIGIK